MYNITMNMTKLTSETNLRLAWRRILTGQNASYREYQTIETAAFAWAEEDNLNQLRNELISYSFEPSESRKIFLPKPSGLLRPITVLGVKDTIVYQAIGNIIANQVHSEFSENYFHLVFSNVLPKNAGSHYFFRNWKRCRKILDSTIKEKLNDGYTWIGKLDLASFYDIVDHRV